MNILLTGGSGYIGSHVAVSLAEKGYGAVLLDNLTNSTADVVSKIEEITKQRLALVVADVRDTATVRAALRAHDVSAVIHLAGLKAVGDSIEKPIEYYANNVQGTISLLQAMQAESVKMLIFSGSATVYGLPQYLPLDEHHPTGATNPYGRSKLQVEEILRDLVRSDSNWRVASLRYFNPVGAHESMRIGEWPRSSPTNLLPIIMQVATGRLSELQVFGNDYETIDGTGVRDYIHVSDLAEGHVATLDYLHQNSGWHTFNLGTGKGYSVFEVLGAFERVSGRKIPYKVSQRRPGDVAACYANPAQALAKLNWQAQRDLVEMCSSAWGFAQSDCVK